MGKKRESPAWQFYPPEWPECYWCGDPALSGHLTCGSVKCSEGAARDATRFLTQDCCSAQEEEFINAALDALQARNGHRKGDQPQ